MPADGTLEAQQPPQPRLSIGRRLFYTHLLVALMVAFGLGAILHWSAESELRSGLDQRLADNAALVSSALAYSGDWEALRLPSDTARPEYVVLMQRMQAMISRSPALARVLVFRRDEDGLRAVGDSLGATAGFAPGDRLPAFSGGRPLAAIDASALDGGYQGFNVLAAAEGTDGRYRVALQIRVEDIDEKLQALRTHSSIAFVLAVLAALAMSAWLAQSARKVLRRFAERFREIAEGKVGQRLDLAGNDEFVDLAGAFEEMNARLQQSQRQREGALDDLRTARDRLEQMVRERSAELERLNDMLRGEIEQRCQLEAALAEAAATDSLTRLLNRRGMLEALEHTAEQARRQKSSFVVVIGDLDHFKQINDQHGHAVGDQVLMAFSRRIKQSLRDLDVAGRWGGEEFLLLWPGIGITEAEKRANQLREVIAAAPIYQGGPQVTVSLGIAEFTGLDSLDRCLNRADRALYRAKLEGRNRVCVSL